MEGELSKYSVRDSIGTYPQHIYHGQSPGRPSNLSIFEDTNHHESKLPYHSHYTNGNGQYGRKAFMNGDPMLVNQQERSSHGNSPFMSPQFVRESHFYPRDNYKGFPVVPREDKPFSGIPKLGHYSPNFPKVSPIFPLDVPVFGSQEKFSSFQMDSPNKPVHFPASDYVRTPEMDFSGTEISRIKSSPFQRDSRDSALVPSPKDLHMLEELTYNRSLFDNQIEPRSSPRQDKFRQYSSVQDQIQKEFAQRFLLETRGWREHGSFSQPFNKHLEPLRTQLLSKVPSSPNLSESRKEVNSIPRSVICTAKKLAKVTESDDTCSIRNVKDNEKLNFEIAGGFGRKDEADLTFSKLCAETRKGKQFEDIYSAPNLFEKVFDAGGEVSKNTVDNYSPGTHENFLRIFEERHSMPESLQKTAVDSRGTDENLHRANEGSSRNNEGLLQVITEDLRATSEGLNRKYNELPKVPELIPRAVDDTRQASENMRRMPKDSPQTSRMPEDRDQPPTGVQKSMKVVHPTHESFRITFADLLRKPERLHETAEDIEKSAENLCRTHEGRGRTLEAPRTIKEQHGIYKEKHKMPESFQGEVEDARGTCKEIRRKPDDRLSAILEGRLRTSNELHKTPERLQRALEDLDHQHQHGMPDSLHSSSGSFMATELELASLKESNDKSYVCIADGLNEIAQRKDAGRFNFSNSEQKLFSPNQNYTGAKNLVADVVGNSNSVIESSLLNRSRLDLSRGKFSSNANAGNDLVSKRSSSEMDKDENERACTTWKVAVTKDEGTDLVSKSMDRTVHSVSNTFHKRQAVDLCNVGHLRCNCESSKKEDMVIDCALELSGNHESSKRQEIFDRKQTANTEQALENEAIEARGEFNSEEVLMTNQDELSSTLGDSEREPTESLQLLAANSASEETQNDDEERKGRNMSREERAIHYAMQKFKEMEERQKGKRRKGKRIFAMEKKFENGLHEELSCKQEETDVNPKKRKIDIKGNIISSLQIDAECKGNAGIDQKMEKDVNLKNKYACTKNGVGKEKHAALILRKQAILKEKTHAKNHTSEICEQNVQEEPHHGNVNGHDTTNSKHATHTKEWTEEPRSSGPRKEYN